jgi:hypothetical protein
MVSSKYILCLVSYLTRSMTSLDELSTGLRFQQPFIYRSIEAAHRSETKSFGPKVNKVGEVKNREKRFLFKSDRKVIESRFQK